ncbi:ABC transporter substrate-binding protein [Nocardia speluncae]|uniref:ABC transporter substrate-binding protein n=1 Tax=Nocardia speluncae TaxID=419477 RepID=A0A846XEA2_9NOCA|nr:ABC transporter substrate-binding protein [Nocardia speluncae]NKY33509.1 ABC transporter substrate-binding protein [Nocardia speluncae]
MTNWSRRSFLAAAAVLPAVVAACGSLSDPGPGSTVGDTLRISLSRSIKTINPYSVGSPDADRAVQGAVYSALTRTGADGSTQPEIATSWREVDELTWQFTLRQDAAFPDGTPLTSQDILWNFDHLLDPADTTQSGSKLRAFVSAVSLPQSEVLQFSLREPATDLPGRLSLIYLTTAAFAANNNLDTAAWGTGPYRLDDIDLENGAQLSLNPHYFGPAPAFPEVAFSVLASEAARVAGLQSGEIDLALTIEPSNLPQFADSHRTVLAPGPRAHTLAINESHPALADPRVRRALNYGIDKQAIVSSIFGKDFPILPGQVLFGPYQDPAAGVGAYPYDPEQAKALLAESGHGGGLSLEVSIPAGSYVAGETVVQAIAQQLAAIGVTLRLTPEADSFDRQAGPNPPDLAYIAWTTEYKGGYQWLDYYTTTFSMSNTTDIGFDTLLTRALATGDPTTQRDLIDRAMRRYHDEADTVFLWPAPLTAVHSAALNWTPRVVVWPQEVTRAGT